MLVSVGLMHLVLFGCMFMKSQKVKIINEGVWIIKIMVAGLIALILRLIVSTVLFEYMSYLSVWSGHLLYLFFGMVFIDLVYTLDSSIDQYAKHNHKGYILKAIMTVILFLASMFMCFVSFKYNEYWISWVNVGCLLVFVLVAFLRVFSENSVFVALSVGLCLSAISFLINFDQ